MKTFKFNNEIITIEQTGYGQYTLRGLATSVHCTDSEVWDWCDDEENEEKHLSAKETAYNMLKNAQKSWHAVQTNIMNKKPGTY